MHLEGGIGEGSFERTHVGEGIWEAASGGGIWKSRRRHLGGGIEEGTWKKASGRRHLVGGRWAESGFERIVQLWGGLG